MEIIKDDNYIKDKFYIKDKIDNINWYSKKPDVRQQHIYKLFTHFKDNIQERIYYILDDIDNKSREGIVKYSGTIKIKSPKGKDVLFPFKSEYIVARPALTVSADKMNVVYLGLENPISVSVPGVPNEKLTVSASNAVLKNNGSGKFIMDVKSGPQVDVTVAATMGNGEKRNMGVMTFRVKRIPKPVAKIADITDEGLMTKGNFQGQKFIYAYYENFDFSATCKVVSFEMSYFSKGLYFNEVVKGNQITEALHTIYNKQARFSKIRFENIKAVGPDGAIVKLSPLTLKVN